MPLHDKHLLWIAAAGAEAAELEEALRAESLASEMVRFEGSAARVLRGRAAVYCEGGEVEAAHVAALRWLAGRGGGSRAGSERDRRVALRTSGLVNLGLKDRRGHHRDTITTALTIGGAAWFVSLIVRGVHGPSVLIGLCVLSVLAYRTLRARAPRPDLALAIAAAEHHAHSALKAGQSDAAVAYALHLIDLLPREICLYRFVNDGVEVLVNAGRYREALDLSAHWSRGAESAGRMLDEPSWGLVEINLAEAEYNLGRLDEAWQRMCNLERAELTDPLVRSGMLLQKAWIEVLRDHGAEARALVDRADLEAIPRVYRAEVFYTRAAALCYAGDFDAAAREAEAGRSLAERASSERNGLFLLGTIAYRAGRLEEAADRFARGADHPYTYQGGDALLSWGEALRALGRDADARRAYELVLERDGQCAAAKQARQRLREPTAKP